MADSILNSTKQILGIPVDYLAFDLMVKTHINSTLATLTDLGVGPAGGFAIADDTETWDDLGLTVKQINMVPTYVFLKVKLLFDPPSTSFHLEALKEQIREHEFRLQQSAESLIPLPVPQPNRPKPPNYSADGQYVLVPLDDVMDGGV